MEKAQAQEGGPPPVEIVDPEPVHPAKGTTLDREAKGYGLGLIIGLPTGLSGAYRPGGRAWYDAALAWSFDRGTLQTHFDVELTLVDLRTEDIPDIHFPVYLGVGPRIHLGDSPYTLHEELVELGVRVPVGMGFIHDGLPLEAFVEVAPGLDIYPATVAICDVALGGRFYFP
jgi:hypothetical protein